MTALTPQTAVAFVLQATPWVPLVIRRGSSADVSVKIPLDDDDDDDDDDHGGVDRTRCVVWQFRIEEFDIAFQIVENGRPLQEHVRYAATAADDDNVSPQELVSAEGVISAAMRGNVFTFRWDNSYSIVRHKRVFYRLVVTSTRAVRAAQTAADETYQRHTTSKAEPSPVKPHLAKRLALERRLTVDEVSLEQTRAICELQRCVTDMVSMFMTDPDRPLHEGTVREFLLSLEAVLRNGIKEKYLSAWPEEPYFEFLLHIESVLRDDKQLVADVKALPPASKLQYLGWTRARALLLLALNRNMLHYAFENLIKRRTVVETYYDSHGLLFMYSSANQIAAYLSALNGVKFLLVVYPDEGFLSEVELPSNLKQCAPNDNFVDDVISLEIFRTGYVLRSGDAEDPDEMKTIGKCSVARSLLANRELEEVTIGRGLQVAIPIQMPDIEGGVCVSLQLRVLPGDVDISIAVDQGNAVNYVIEPFLLSPSHGWLDVLLISDSAPDVSLVVLLDNSNAMMRARQVAYRVRSVTIADFDAAWEACQGVAQSISWKVATKAGIERCQAYMEDLHLQQQQDVVEQQQRSREASGSHDDDVGDATTDDDSLFGRGASLIAKPVSFLVSGFLGVDGDGSPVSCSQCLSPFTFFSRQYQCPSCQSVVCIPCSRHIAQVNGKGPQVKMCDRCFIKEMDMEKKRRAVLGSNSSGGGECAAYAALRDDPSMEKYFKMLSFGVPHSGVAQKMLQDEMPSDKIVVFSAGPSGTIEEQSIDGNTKRRARTGSVNGTGSSRGNSFRKVHWKSLEEKKANASIWNRETSRRKTAPIRLSPQDYHEVARLFGRAPALNATLGTQSSSGKKKQVFSALDSRRSNNIAIGLSQFKSVGGADAILKGLKECDLDFLTPDRLSNIYEIAPTSVEAKRYTNFRGSRSRLEAAENFLVEMCEIHRVTEKIAAMQFVAQFEDQHRELRNRIRSITDACYQILQSERLARFFELVLAIGNLLNSGTDIENSGGVTLESLLKLSETKSIDQGMTLLHFIVRLIHDRGESDVLLFIQDLSVIAEAKRFSNVVLLSQAKTLQSGVTQAQMEIKEEMIDDVKKFEKAEELRRKQHEQAVHAQHVRRSESEVAPRAGELSGSSTENPQTALMDMLRKRNQNGAVAQSPKNPSHPLAARNPSIGRGALLAAIQKHGEVQEESPQLSTSTPSPMPKRNALLAGIRNRGLNLEQSNPKDSPHRTDKTHQAALVDATKQKATEGEGAINTNGTTTSTPVGLPPRANLLSAIRARGLQDKTNASERTLRSSVNGTTESAQSEFKPKVYSVDDNCFITVMRKRIMDIKATMEQLEIEVEALVSVWESTARYLGEDPASSSSEYVLQLLNRFILDVKIAKSLLARQGLGFQSLSLVAQVGSMVATRFGPCVVTAVRSDTKLEVLYPWSRESYLSPSSILSVGAVVRCRRFGVGVLRSTHYDRGFCQVRFGFGYGIVRVEDLKLDTSSTASALKRTILSSSFVVGDPVITPFGCGSVRSVNVHDGADERRIVINLTTENEDVNAPIAYVQRHHVKLNY